MVWEARAKRHSNEVRAKYQNRQRAKHSGEEDEQCSERQSTKQRKHAARAGRGQSVLNCLRRALFDPSVTRQRGQQALRTASREDSKQRGQQALRTASREDSKQRGQQAERTASREDSKQREQQAGDSKQRTQSLTSKGKKCYQML
jgi:hypothetical protein